MFYLQPTHSNGQIASASGIFRYCLSAASTSQRQPATPALPQVVDVHHRCRREQLRHQARPATPRHAASIDQHADGFSAFSTLAFPHSADLERAAKKCRITLGRSSHYSLHLSMLVSVDSVGYYGRRSGWPERGAVCRTEGESSLLPTEQDSSGRLIMFSLPIGFDCEARSRLQTRTMWMEAWVKSPPTLALSEGPPSKARRRSLTPT